MALLSALTALLDPGDEVLCFSPAWVSYEPIIGFAGGVMRRIPLNYRSDFVFDPDDLGRAVTGKTKVFLLNNPHNPTGKVFTYAELNLIAKFANEHGLVVVSDEIYEHIIFDGRRHVSIACLEGMQSRTVTISGVSKGYAMMGWRIGFAAAPSSVATAMVVIQQQTTTCAAPFIQVGAAKALTDSTVNTSQMVREFQRRRDYLVVSFKDFSEFLDLPICQGTFYAFPRVVSYNSRSSTFADLVLERVGVALIPGSVFGPDGESFFRLSFACSMENLNLAITRLHTFFGVGIWDENVAIDSFPEWRR